MPFKSEAQRRFMYAKHPEMAKRWEKETPRKKLPSKVTKQEDLDAFLKEAEEFIKEAFALPDLLRKSSAYRASKKAYRHIKRSGLSGRTPEEVAVMMKKAALFRTEVGKRASRFRSFKKAGRFKKALPWIAAGVGAAAGGMYLGKRLKDRSTRKAKELKSRMVRMSPGARKKLERKLKRQSRMKKYVGGGAIGGAAIGVATTGMNVQYELMKQGVPHAYASQYWRDLPTKKKWMYRGALGTVGAGTGALQGYISAKRAEVAEKDQRVRKALKKQRRHYESVEDVVNSLVYEEYADEG